MPSRHCLCYDSDLPCGHGLYTPTLYYLLSWRVWTRFGDRTHQLAGTAEMKILKLDQIMHKYKHGFTLIELMIVVAVIGILAAIALPNYQQYVLRANRADAMAILTESAQYMERYYTTNTSYTSATLLSAVSPKGASGTGIKYNITFSVTPNATAYTLRAAPANGQANDTCGTLTLSQTGAQTAAMTTGCW
jgi:type IV pilus assembly protein PilE